MKKLLKKIYTFLYKTGYVAITIFLLTIVSMGLVSYKLKSEKSLNPYCKLENQDIYIVVEHSKIQGFNYYFNCNTLNIEIEMIDGLTIDEVITVLLDVKATLEKNQIIYNSHVIVSADCLENYLFANLNLGEEGIIYLGN